MTSLNVSKVKLFLKYQCLNVISCLDDKEKKNCQHRLGKTGISPDDGNMD
jgi:hypothetical protein